MDSMTKRIERYLNRKAESSKRDSQKTGKKPKRPGYGRSAFAILCAAAMTVTTAAADLPAQAAMDQTSSYEVDSTDASYDSNADVNAEANEAAEYGTSSEDTSGENENTDITGDSSADTAQEETAQAAQDNTDTAQDRESDQSAEETASEEDTEEAVSYASGTLTYGSEEDAYKVTVTFDESAILPEGITLSAEEIPADDNTDPYDYNNYLAQAQKKLNEEDEKNGVDLENIDTVHFYDILFIDADGNKVEPDPNASLQVKVSYKDGLEKTEEQTIQIFHFTDDNDTSTNKIDLLTNPNVTGSDTNVKADEVSFDTNRFSVYAIALISTPAKEEAANSTTETGSQEASAAESSTADATAGETDEAAADTTKESAVTEESAAAAETAAPSGNTGTTASEAVSAEAVTNVPDNADENAGAATASYAAGESVEETAAASTSKEKTDTEAAENDYPSVTENAEKSGAGSTAPIQEKTGYAVGTQEATAGNAAVKVSYTEDSKIPEGAKLVVEKAEDTESYQAEAESLLPDYEIEGGSYLDIHFELNGEEYPVNNTTDVIITFSNQTALGENEEIKVVHFGDNGPELIEAASQDKAGFIGSLKNGLRKIRSVFTGKEATATSTVKRDVSFTANELEVYGILVTSTAQTSEDGIVTTTTQATENTGDSDVDTKESDTQSSEQAEAGTSSTEEKKDETASEKKDEESVADGGSTEQSSESTTNAGTDESTTASTDESTTTAGTDESAASESTTDGADVTYISGTQTASVGNATVKVTYDETAQIPEGAELVVSTSDNADALEAKTEELFSGFETSNSTCLNIHFENEDGKEIEPKGNVAVSITLSNQAVLEEGQEVSVLHFKDDGSVEIVDKDVQDVASANIATKGLNAIKRAFSVGTVKTNREISFTTNSFSDWVVTYVDTSGNSSTISTATNTSASAVASDGTYTVAVPVYNKNGTQAYTVNLELVVSGGKITSGSLDQGTAPTSAITHIASTWYSFWQNINGRTASLDGLNGLSNDSSVSSGTSSIDAVSSASTGGSSSSSSSSSAKYTVDLVSAAKGIITNAPKTSSSSSGSSGSSTTVADGTYKGSASVGNYTLGVIVTVSGGKITAVENNTDVTTTNGDWSSMLSSSGSQYQLDKYIGQDASTATVDAISGATTEGGSEAGYAATIRNAISNALSNASAGSSSSSGSSGGSGSSSGGSSSSTPSDAGTTISAGGSATIYVGETVTLSGTYSSMSSDSDSVWTSGNTSIATVSKNTYDYSGNEKATVTGVAAGTVTITHTIAAGYFTSGTTETYTITVASSGGSSSGGSASGTYTGSIISPTSLTDGDYIIIGAGNKYALTGTQGGSSGNGYYLTGISPESYSTSAGGTATVSDASAVWTYKSGVFTNKSTGQSLTMGGDAYSAMVSSNGTTMSTKIISGYEGALYNGSYTLANNSSYYPAGFTWSYNRNASWSAGYGVYFYAIEDGGSSAQSSNITASPTSVSVAEGSTASVTLTLTGCNVSTATSADSGVAMVSRSGNTLTITGVKAGTTSITVSGTAEDGYSAPGSITIPVTVTSSGSSASGTIVINSDGDAITVTKEWESGTTAADSVVVTISSTDGTYSKDITLSSSNSWTDTVEELDSSKTYTVAEKSVTDDSTDVTNDYTATVTRGADTYVEQTSGSSGSTATSTTGYTYNYVASQADSSTGRVSYTVSNQTFTSNITIAPNVTVTFSGCKFQGCGVIPADSSAVAVFSNSCAFQTESGTNIVSLSNNIFASQDTNTTITAGSTLGSGSGVYVGFPTSTTNNGTTYTLSSASMYMLPGWAAASSLLTGSGSLNGYKGFNISGTTPSTAGYQLFVVEMTYTSSSSGWSSSSDTVTFRVPMYMNVGSATSETKVTTYHNYTVTNARKETTTHTITGSVTNGTMTINGTTISSGSSQAVSVNDGESYEVTYTADSGYEIDSITVDGSAVSTSDNATSYTFSNVTGDHTINVVFKASSSSSSSEETSGVDKITVNKAWKDASGNTASAPDGAVVTAAVKNSSGSTVDTLTLNSSNSYTATTTATLSSSETYTVEETAVTDGSSSIAGNYTVTYSDPTTAGGITSSTYNSISSGKTLVFTYTYNGTTYALNRNGTSVTQTAVTVNSDGTLSGVPDTAKWTAASARYGTATYWTLSNGGYYLSLAWVSNSNTAYVTTTAPSSSSSSAALSFNNDSGNVRIRTYAATGSSTRSYYYYLSTSNGSISCARYTSSTSSTPTSFAPYEVEDSVTSYTITNTAKSSGGSSGGGGGSTTSDTDAPDHHKSISGTGTDDDPYTLNLNVTGKSSSSSSTTTTSDQVDVVLVVDVSGSMSGTKLSTLKSAVTNSGLINSVLGNNTDGHARMSLVYFASALDNGGTEDLYFMGSYSGTTYDDAKVAQGWTTNASTMTSAFSSLTAYENYGTNVDAGLYTAGRQLATDARSDAKKVVILISDGAPTSYYTSEGYGATESATGVSATSAAQTTANSLASTYKPNAYYAITTAASASDYKSFLVSLGNNFDNSSTTQVYEGNNDLSTMTSALSSVGTSITTVTTKKLEKVTITDTLTDYVDFQTKTGNYGVTVKDSNNNTVASSNYTVSVSDKTITIKFDDDYEFTNGVTYTASFPVVATDTAQTAADAASTTTSTFETNTTAKIDYTYGGTTGSSDYSEKPTITLSKVEIPDVTPTVSNDAVAVHKSVSHPQGYAADKFRVSLSVDVTSVISNYFKYSNYIGTTSNTYKDATPGTLYSSIESGSTFDVRGTSAYSGGSYAVFDIYGSDGTTLIAEDITLYMNTTSNNTSLFVKLSDTQYVLVGRKVQKNSSDNTLTLTSDAQAALTTAAVNSVTLSKIEDQMGSYVTYAGNLTVNGSSATATSTSNPKYDESTKTLTWDPVAAKSVTGTLIDETITNSGGTQTTVKAYKYEDVAELSYDVTLNTDASGFKDAPTDASSSILNGATATDGGNATQSGSTVTGSWYNTNTKATLTYTTTATTGNQTIDFPTPLVQGTKADTPLTGMTYDQNGRAILLALLAIAAVAGTGFYYRKKRRRA